MDLILESDADNVCRKIYEIGVLLDGRKVERVVALVKSQTRV